MMFKNYFKTALRNFRKNKTFSFINIFGLTIGLTCCLLIALYIKHELSYDDFELKWIPEFGRPVVFAWEEVESVTVRYQREWKVMLAGGRKVKLTGYAVGAHEFLWKLKSRSRVEVPHLTA